ncbi:MAG: hypothetical protein U9Q03_02015 [Patescibacteria group bacterium]|nr:hypothetical protein [Patescibacteria group bacterium]
MSRYVVPDLPTVDRKVDEDIKTIVDALRTALKSNLRAVLLCGGFGRGEGSVISVDGEMRPYNDYDLVLVTKRYVPKARLQELAERLARQIGIRFVDLGVIRESMLGRLPRSVFVCDLQESRQVYGDEDVLARTTKVSPDGIGIEEARIQLRNRVICFLELTPDEWFLGQPMKDDDRRRMVLQISKAMTASVISDLIRVNRYVTSYQAQLETFLATGQHPMIRDLMETAYGVKLGLKDSLEVDVNAFWLSARELFLERYGRLVESESDAKVQPKSISATVKDIVKRLMYGEKTVSERAKRRVRKVTWLTLRAFDESNHIDKEIGVECSRLLSQWFEITVAPDDWNGMRRACSELWQRYHH